MSMYKEEDMEERELKDIDPNNCNFILTDNKGNWCIDTDYIITKHEMTDDEVREWMRGAIKVLKKRIKAVSKTIKDPTGKVKIECKNCNSEVHTSKNCPEGSVQ